ncbi:MAG: ABC transporter substrate-binding protein [Planctomycetota bacterium]
MKAKAGRYLVGLLLAVAMSFGVASATLAKDVAILTTDSLISTKRTISGATRTISKLHPDVTFKHFLLSSVPQERAAQIDSVKAVRPSVVLTVGSSATETAKASFTKTPIVFAAVLYPVLSGFVESDSRPGKNITGASLNIEIDIQFKKFQRIVPGLKNVGVLYSKNTARLIPSSKVIAQQLGIRLLPLEVNDPKDLPEAFDSLANICDGLWSVADPNLFSPQATKFIVLNTIRRGLPFMGFSRYVVESGALFALDFDYKAVGKQAGAIVGQILDGADPGMISVVSPDIIWFHYNEKTARLVNLTVPEDLVAVAKEVYR